MNPVPSFKDLASRKSRGVEAVKRTSGNKYRPYNARIGGRENAGSRICSQNLPEIYINPTFSLYADSLLSG